MFCCVFSFVVFFFEKPDGYIYAAMLMVRYIIQLVQMAVFWRNQKEHSRSTATIVDFASLPSRSAGLAAYDE